MNNGQISDDQALIDRGEADNDLDQRLKPAGRTYVEIYNPWTDGAILASELYRDSNGSFRRYDSDLDGTIDYTTGSVDTFVEGLLLDRLSDGVSANGLASPVWRMACTETHPLIRNATVQSNNKVAGQTLVINDDPDLRGRIGNGGKYHDITINNGPWAYQSTRRQQFGEGAGGGATRGSLGQLPRAYLAYFSNTFNRTRQAIARGESYREITPRSTDPDFPAFDRLAQPTYLARSNVDISNPGLGNDGKVDRRILAKPIEYIERLFYFNGAPSVEYKASIGNVRDLVDGKNVHVPDLFYDVEIDGALITRLQKASRGDFLTGLTDPFSLENDGLEIATVRAQNGGLPGEPRGVLRVHVSRFPALDYFDVDGDHASDRTQQYRWPYRIGTTLSPCCPVVMLLSAPRVKSLEKARMTTMLKRNEPTTTWKIVTLRLFHVRSVARIRTATRLTLSS